MRLVIRAETLYGRTLAQPVVCGFDAHGGTIGRADGRSMTLPDPERLISRLQAEISAQGGVYAIRNAGSANPIFVNSRMLEPGESCPLADGDKLRIGGYVLGVSTQQDDSLHTIIAPWPAPVPRPEARDPPDPPAPAPDEGDAGR